MVTKKFLKVGQVVKDIQGNSFTLIKQEPYASWIVKGELGEFKTKTKYIHSGLLKYPPEILLVGKKFKAKNGEVATVVEYINSTNVKVEIGGNYFIRTIHLLRKGEFASRKLKRYIKDENGNYIVFKTTNSGDAIALESVGKNKVMIKFLDTGNTALVEWCNLKRGKVFDGDWHKDRPKGVPQPLSQTLEQFKAVHGDRYIYELTQDVGVLERIPIICREHGLFYQQVFSHKSGSGCPRCGEYGYKSNTEGYLYIQKLTGIDGVKYLKFGITNKDPQTRLEQISTHSKFEHTLIFVKHYYDGTIARSVETLLKREYLGCVQKCDLPQGFRETAHFHQLCALLESILYYEGKIKEDQQRNRRNN